MDDASSELLRYPGRNFRQAVARVHDEASRRGRIRRRTGTPPLPALTLRLDPLPEDDARALALAAAGDRRLTEEEVAALMQRAAGNPLFLRELASVGEKTEDTEALPDTVETLVATRIDQLAPGDRALLRWASVLGVSFFDNVALNLTREHLDQAGIVPGTQVEITSRGGRYFAVAARTFSDARPGDLIGSEDSYRNLAVAVAQGSAAALLGVEEGSPLLIEVDTP
jgi:hypothetical protein